MRFRWFHLMPYPFLPDDFTQKLSSVWVDVPSALYDPEKGHWLYHEYLSQLEFADGPGFDGICVNEHHQNAYGLMPSPQIRYVSIWPRPLQQPHPPAWIPGGGSVETWDFCLDTTTCTPT